MFGQLEGSEWKGGFGFCFRSHRSAGCRSNNYNVKVLRCPFFAEVQHFEGHHQHLSWWFAPPTWNDDDEFKMSKG